MEGDCQPFVRTIVAGKDPNDIASIVLIFNSAKYISIFIIVFEMKMKI